MPLTLYVHEWKGKPMNNSRCSFILLRPCNTSIAFSYSGLTEQSITRDHLYFLGKIITDPSSEVLGEIPEYITLIQDSRMLYSDDDWWSDHQIEDLPIFRLQEAVNDPGGFWQELKEKLKPVASV